MRGCRASRNVPMPRRLHWRCLVVPVLAVAAGAWSLAADSVRLRLRGLLLGAAVALALLLPIMLCLSWRARARRRRGEPRRGAAATISSAACAKALFVIGRDLRLGAICSASMGELLRVQRARWPAHRGAAAAAA